MALKAAAAYLSTTQRLSTWKVTIPPCTNSSTNGDCALCDWSVPDSQCGGAKGPEGLQVYCNWRFVECRSKRVIALHMGEEGLSFSTLPAALANITMLETLDLSRNQVMGGTLPVEYSAYANLTAFRISGNVAGALPITYSAWIKLKVFEVTGTNLSGNIPTAYFASWTQLENFTIDGANISGHLPAPWSCLQLRMYMVQNTPVVSDSANLAWFLNPQAGSLTQMTILAVGRCHVGDAMSNRALTHSWCVQLLFSEP
eukprot:GHRR01026261.1.p2 GENE.GHRR01026261.1~~GHRR01026261.1.p2  ORF type:complete len:257 (+),score=67.10 GHRR01026261.1:247-1017(+)